AVASVGGSQTAGAKPFGLRSRVSLLLVSSGDDSIQFGGLQQVFRPAGGLLSATCILDREHGNLKTAVQHFVAPIPGCVEVQPRDGRHHVDTNRLDPELINTIGIEEIVNRNVAERCAKTSKRSIGALSVRAVGGYTDPGPWCCRAPSVSSPRIRRQPETEPSLPRSTAICRCNLS